MKTDRDEQLRRRAYRIWEAEGRPDGMEADHWARAEREMAAEEGNVVPAPASRRSRNSRSSEAAAGNVSGAPVRKKAAPPGPKPASSRKKKI